MIFATWFTYDFSGAALPLSATLTKVGPEVYSGTLIKAAGPPFSAVPFNPGAVTRTEVGTATVTFSDGDAATFSYQVSLGGNPSAVPKRSSGRCSGRLAPCASDGAGVLPRFAA